MSRKQCSWQFLVAGLFPSLIIITWGVLRSPQNAFDDAFITYRYADNLRNGLGLVYNPGEWVLGTTAPFYAVMLGALSSLGATVEWWGHWVSVFGWIVSAWAALGQLWQRQRHIAGAVAAFLIAVLPLIGPALGMETSFLLALLLLTSWAWMSDRNILAPLLSAIAVLTRQDAVLFVGLLCIARSVSNKRFLWREALLSTALVLPWFIYAYWRYGAILPNSALAKINQSQFMAAGGGKSFGEQFLLHLSDGSPFAAVAIGVSLAVGLYVIVRHAREWWWLPCWVVLYVGTYIGLKVVSFPWYFVAPLAGIILICAIGLGYLLGDCRTASTLPRITGVIRPALALICVLVIGYTYGNTSLAESLNNGPGYLVEYRDIGAWLAANTLKTDRVATIEIGVIGRLSQRPILDTMGLVSPEMRGHLVGWAETLTYAIGQRNPEYAVTLTGTAWDSVTPQWWFRERYRPVATYGRATIYQRQEPATTLRYSVNQRAEFDSGFAITGLEAPEQNLTPGEKLRILLHVEVARNPGSDCQVIMHLVDTATFERVSESKDRPYGGGYSCLAWQPGDSLRIPLQIDVPQDIASGTYRIGLELFGIANKTYFPLKGNPDAQEVQLGWLRVGSPERQTVNVPRSDTAVHWENGITLQSVAVADQPLIQGELLPIEFDLQAGRTPDRDLTFFAHLIDSAGNIVAQTDKRPFYGRFPTTVWQPGEVLQDRYMIPIPGGILPGEYRLRVGFYDGLGRLPLADGTSNSAILDRVLVVQNPFGS